MPNFFLCQIYVCNGTNKRRKKKLKERKRIHVHIKIRPLGHWYNEANTKMHSRQADLFNLISVVAHENVY